MEQEIFLTGYCRCIDQSRMVELITEDGKLSEVDCGYATCPHAQSCQIAEKIRQATDI